MRITPVGIAVPVTDSDAQVDVVVTAGSRRGAGPRLADALDAAERAAAAGTVQAGSATWDTPNTSPDFPLQPSTPREPATHCAVFAAELLRGVSPTVTPVRTGLQGERAGSAR
jgi:hypothetical protein